MPYRTNAEVPKQKNTKTAKQKRTFREVFNSVVEHGGSESSAFAIANAKASGAEKNEKKDSRQESPTHEKRESPAQKAREKATKKPKKG